MTPEQFDRGLCAMCLTSASLSALVGLAASHQQRRSTDVGPSTCAAAQRGGCYCSGACYRRGLGRRDESPSFRAPIYFGTEITGGTTWAMEHVSRVDQATVRADFEGLPAKWPSDTAWTRQQFGDGAIQ